MRGGGGGVGGGASGAPHTTSKKDSRHQYAPTRLVTPAGSADLQTLWEFEGKDAILSFRQRHASSLQNKGGGAHLKNSALQVGGACRTHTTHHIAMIPH